MPGNESVYPADWLRIAERDLVRVSRLLDVHDAAAAGFFLQQAVEKCLKALLLSRGWKLQRIHDLEALLNAALGHDPGLERFRAACQKITAYYMLERYPLVRDTGLTDQDIRESLAQVAGLIEAVRREVRGRACD